MTRGKARERRQARTHDAIVQAAQEIIETLGPESLSMRSIAERVDYSASNLYEYFSSKDEVLSAVMKEALSRLILHVRDITAGLPASQRLLSYGQAYLEFAQSHPQLYLLIFGHEATPANESGETPYDLLRQIVQEGIAEGSFAPRPDFGLHEMTFGCWSLVHGMVMLRLKHFDETMHSSDASDTQILECYLAGMRTN